MFRLFLVFTMMLFVISTESRMMSFHRPVHIGRKKQSNEKPIVTHSHEKCECVPMVSNDEAYERGSIMSQANGRPLKTVYNYECTCIDMGFQPVSGVEAMFNLMLPILCIIVFWFCF